MLARVARRGSHHLGQAAMALAGPRGASTNHPPRLVQRPVVVMKSSVVGQFIIRHVLRGHTRDAKGLQPRLARAVGLHAVEERRERIHPILVALLLPTTALEVLLSDLVRLTQDEGLVRLSHARFTIDDEIHPEAFVSTPGASMVGVSELVGLVLLPAVVGASELVGLGMSVPATTPPGVVSTEDAELGAKGGPSGAALELVGLVLLPAVVGASELVGLRVADPATAPPGVVGTEDAELGARGGFSEAALA